MSTKDQVDGPLVVPKWALAVIVGAIAVGGGSTAYDKLRSDHEPSRVDAKALADIEARLQVQESITAEIPKLRDELARLSNELARLNGNLEARDGLPASEPEAPTPSRRRGLGR